MPAKSCATQSATCKRPKRRMWDGYGAKCGQAPTTSRMVIKPTTMILVWTNWIGESKHKALKA